MEKRVLCVRHSDGPEDDRVTNFCKINGFHADIRRPFRGDALGEVTDDLAGVVVYGGMYNAYDTNLHPFLNEEYRMMRAAIDAKVPLLGLCQGAQMIAHMHGAFAGASENGAREFGCYEVTPTDAGRDVIPEPVHMFQWHFHTFDVPSDGELLASSALFENQAFRIGDLVYGFQGHPENTIEGFRRWQAKASEDDYAKPGVQTKTVQTELMYRHDAAQADWFYGFLRRHFGSGTA